MKQFQKIQYIYDKLINFENYINAQASRGPTILTLYLENFSAQLMGVYYGEKYTNINYSSHNTAGYDLLSENGNHGVQVTHEKNNTNKAIESIRKSHNISALTVFFFNHAKVDTIEKNIKAKLDFKPSVSHWEVKSLHDIFVDAETNPLKAKEYTELCKLWIDGIEDYNVDIIDLFNNDAYKKVSANINSKKYIPEIYIPEIELKKKCRVFSDKYFANQLLFYECNTIYQGDIYNWFKDKKAKLHDGKWLTFNADCDATKELNEDINDRNITTLLSKLKNYRDISKGRTNGVNYYDTSDSKIDFNTAFSNSYSGLYFTIDEILNLYSISSKQFFLIVKDAGQGKTNFLCNFFSSVLQKRKIPVIFININELTKSLLDTFKERIELVLKRNFIDGITFLEQYFLCLNKKVIVIIDGLNEKNNLPEFRKELLEFFHFIEEYDLFKVIATSRYVAYETFFESFNEESFGDKIYCEIKRQHYNNHNQESFKKQIYKKYRDYFNFGCSVSKIAKDKLTSDTLLLRIFSEVYQNNSDSVISDIFLYRLFFKYIEKRSSELYQAGKIKRTEDIFQLLFKLADLMINNRQLSYFSNSTLLEKEKDLLDVIVNEDILIKTYEEDSDQLYLPKINYSFTYDEFRDYLIAQRCISFDNSTFTNELHYMEDNKESYEGVLKYLFLILKSSTNNKLRILETSKIYNNIYSSNLFSLEDKFITQDDIKNVEYALSQHNKWVIYNLCIRLNVTHFKNLSVITLVDYRVNTGPDIEQIWDDLFVQYSDFDYNESGILPDLLHAKMNDTTKEEVFGILLLLSTFNSWACEAEDLYVEKLFKDYHNEAVDALNRIETMYPVLSNKIDLLRGLLE